MSEPVLVERRDDVAIVTLHMPEKRNALGEKMYSALSKTLTELQDDLSLRALVLYGGRLFCAGGDLSSMSVTPRSRRYSSRSAALSNVPALVNVPTCNS